MVTDREHGRQFKAVLVRISPPNTLTGIERYLGSGMVKGIGPVYAGRLVKAFAAAVFDIIEQTPERLQEVEGIGVRYGFSRQVVRTPVLSSRKTRTD